MKSLAVAVLASILAMGAVGPSRADVSGFLPGAGLIDVPVVSLRDQRFAGIIRQQTDYSCGAAAMATLLDNAYGYSLNERSTILGMLRVSDYDTVRYRGFSMLDMKHYAESLGMTGIGYRMDLPTLYKVKVPAIALMSIEGYDHFVVLKKATPEYVYVADPMLGNRAIPASDFAAAWNGIIFVVAARGYNSQSTLADIPLYVGSTHLSVNVPPSAYVLANAVLMTVFIPPAARL